MARLYAPKQDLSGTNSMELSFLQTVHFQAKSSFQADGKTEKHPVALFDNASFVLFPTDAKISDSTIYQGYDSSPSVRSPELLLWEGRFLLFGKFSFNTSLEGGVNTTVKNPDQ